MSDEAASLQIRHQGILCNSCVIMHGKLHRIPEFGRTKLDDGDSIFIYKSND